MLLWYYSYYTHIRTPELLLLKLSSYDWNSTNLWIIWLAGQCNIRSATRDSEREREKKKVIFPGKKYNLYLSRAIANGKVNKIFRNISKVLAWCPMFVLFGVSFRSTQPNIWYVTVENWNTTNHKANTKYIKEKKRKLWKLRKKWETSQFCGVVCVYLRGSSIIYSERFSYRCDSWTEK